MKLSPYSRWLVQVLLAGLFGLLGSCNVDTGHLAGGGIGGTGITAGTITGFGSVFVNGIEFDTAGASRSVNDVVTVSNGLDDAGVLDSGMVVTIEGSVNPNGITGTATSITYDAVLKGPLATQPAEDPDGNFKVFRVLETTVSVDRNATVFVNTDYQSLQLHGVVEVSGYLDADGVLIATRVVGSGPLDQDTVVLIRGTVNGFDGIDSFMVGALKITFDGTTVFEALPGTVTDGQLVEVNGRLLGVASINATRIEHESPVVEYYSGGISLEGLVSAFADVGNFTVNGVHVDASNAVFVPSDLAAMLQNDQLVEVAGSIDNGVVTAARVELRGGRVKLAGQVSARDDASGTVSIDIVPGQEPVTVTVNLQTQLEDDLSQVQPFTLGQIEPGDPVVVRGYLDNTARVVAVDIRRRILEAHVLTGPVSAASGTAFSGSVTVLGITMATAAGTEFEDSDDRHFPGGGDGFYAQVQPGDIVELEDELPVDGIADEVELGN